jgi:hypothetical protein
MDYKSLQKKIQIKKLCYTNPALFNYDKGGGTFDKSVDFIFILKDGKNNLYEPITDEAMSYFKENYIAWWGDNENHPAGHLLSSQIQCLNFLFAIKNDLSATLLLAKLFDNEIDNILPVIGDNVNQFIAFEFVHNNAELLGENDAGAMRGKFCTSVDALIIAQRKGKKILIPIEWKYTESYLNGENKALEHNKGQTRQNRYNHLIEKSEQLICFDDLQHSIYYYEPFYEFMRQTLLVEQMKKMGIADDFLHIVIAPDSNTDLLGNNYPFTSDDLETAWRKCLKDKTKFRIIDSKEIFNMLETLHNYLNQTNYLKSRYY